MTQGGDEGMWLRWESGDEGKWWRREVVMKGSGDEGKWWRRGVVMKGCGYDGKCWGREVVTKGSGDEGEWWRREVGTMGSGDVVLEAVYVVLCVSWSCGCRSHCNGCRMLHGLCFGEEAGARNRVFFRVKWLQPAMKGTSSVRRLRLGSFRTRLVPSMCFATSGCSCVRSSMRFLKLWLQIAL